MSYDWNHTTLPDFHQPEPIDDNPLPWWACIVWIVYSALLVGLILCCWRG